MAGNRRAGYVSIPLAPGILSNTTPRGAKVRVQYMAWDRWYDASWVRWIAGLAEKQGGWQYAPLSTPTAAAPQQYGGLARGLKDWASLDGQFWICIATHQHLYLVNNGVLYDITPIRYTSNVNNAFTTQSGSSIVTIVDAANGAQDQDFVEIANATAVGGLTLNGTYQLTFVDLNTYTVNAGADATSSASGGGKATLSYQITCGLPSNGQLYGYGTYLYGEDEYGTPRPAGDGIPARLRSWSVDNYGEDLIASYSDGEIYWWNRSTGPNSDAVLLDASAPTGCQRVLIDGVQRVVIALGCTDITSAYDPLLVRWCDLDDITDWLPTDTNLAGDYPLTNGSRIVTGVKSKGQNLIWTDTHLYRMVLSGGASVYSFYGCGTTKIVGPNAAVDVDGTGFWMAYDNWYTYGGTMQVLDSEVWETVFDPNNSTSLDRTQAEKVYAFAYEEKNEVTWLYPSIGGSGECDRYVTYNWDSGVWYYGAWNRTACQGRSLALPSNGVGNVWEAYPYGVNGGWLYAHEIGTDAVEQAGTSAIPWYLESLDITTGGAKSEFTMGGSDARFAIGGSDSHLRVLSMLPDFKYLTGSMNIYLFTKDRPQDASYVQAGPVAFTDATTQVDIDAHGSQIKIRLDNLTDGGNASLGSSFRMGILQGLATPYGKR